MPDPNLSADHWLKVESIFHAALECPADERAEFVAEASGAEEEIRREVERLLAGDEGATTFLPEPALARAHPRLSDIEAFADPLARPGARIGVYRLERPIGAGGMGTVWRAERDDEQYEQQVALKLIRPGLGEAEILSRFRHERQTLANLHHPNIARLLDGGTTDDGRPYLVMELVDGVPVDRYCDDRRLSVRDRLFLFVKVCDAAEHAHQNLVIHRDLKPANILVEHDGDDAEPKLLDFGIAKVLDDGAAGGDMTATGTRLMTPQYASPEQVRGEPVTTATDVYSLGVILYELLTGHPPYRPDHGRGHELARAICDDEPKRPSTAVLTAADWSVEDGTTRTKTAEELGRARASDPGRLRRQLSGDVDTILLMALRKEPERRYASVGAFSDDIRRFLDGRPVAARPDTLGYRLRKMVARHRAATAAIVVVSIMLVGATIFSASAAQREAAQREIAEDERAIAEGVNEFLNDDLLGAANPFNVPDPDITMREVLDRAAGRVAGRFDENPLVEAAIRSTIGAAYDQLGRYDEAETHLGAALAMHRETLGDDAERTVDSMIGLASVYIDQARLDDAGGLLTEALAIVRRRDAPDRQTAQILADLGVVHLDRGDYDEARTVIGEAIEAASRSAGEDDLLTLGAQVTRAEIARESGEFEEAVRGYTMVLERADRAHGEDHPLALQTRNNLAYVHLERGRNDEAEAIYLRILEGKRRLLGENHRSTLITMSNLSRVWRQQGRLEEAEQLLLEVIERSKAGLGEDHADTVIMMANLAMVYARQGRDDEATTLLADVVRIRRDTLGASHPSTLMGLYNLGRLRQRGGYLDEAETLFVEALAGRRVANGDDHPETLRVMGTLAEVHFVRRQFDEADRLLTEGIERATGRYGADHIQVAAMQVTLADVRADQGRLDESEPLYRNAMAFLGEAFPTNPRTGETLARWGDVLLGLDRLEEAESALLDAHEILSQARGPDDASTREAIESLVRLHETRSDPDEAARWRALLPDSPES